MSLSTADGLQKVGEQLGGTANENLEVLHAENAKERSDTQGDVDQVALGIPEEHASNLPGVDANFVQSREPEEIDAVESTTDSTGPDLGASSRQDNSTPKQKINISYIGDNRKRQVSFCKRKNGAMKKGRELNLMTGSMIGIFVFNPANGWYHEFGTHDPAEILREYAVFSGPSERRRDSKFFDDLEASWSANTPDNTDKPELPSAVPSTPISDFPSKSDVYSSNINTPSDLEGRHVSEKTHKYVAGLEITENTLLSDVQSSSKRDLVSTSIFANGDGTKEQISVPFPRTEADADPLGPFLDEDEWENIYSGLCNTPLLYGPLNGNPFGTMESSSPTSVHLSRKFDFSSSSFSISNKDIAELSRFSKVTSAREDSIMISKRDPPVLAEKPAKIRRIN